MRKVARVGFGLLGILAYNVVTISAASALPYYALQGPMTGAQSQNGRIFRDTIASSCGSVKTYPGVYNTGTSYFYESQTLTYNGPDGCVTFRHDPNPLANLATDCDTNAHLSIYNNSYNPANQAANFLGDIGTSATGDIGIDLVNGQQIVVVVSNTSAQEVCDFEVTSSADFGLGGPITPPSPVGVTQETIRNFMIRRADMIASSQPSASTFHNRFSGSLFGDDSTAADAAAFTATHGPMKQVVSGPPNDVGAARRPEDAGLETLTTSSVDSQAPQTNLMSFTANFEAGNGSASYGTSLHRILRAFGEAGGTETIAGQSFGFGAADGVEMPRLNIWTEGRMNFYRDDVGGAGQRGSMGIGYLGIDYLVHPAILVGALVQVDVMNESSATLGTSTGGTGFMAGPYVSSRIAPFLFLDARAAWGASENTVNPLGTYEDKFDTSRSLYSAKVSGFWSMDNWRFTPSAELIYFTETQQSYVDSLANTIPEQTVDLGRVSFGPEIRYSSAPEGDAVIRNFEATLGVKGIWDFDSDPSRSVGGTLYTVSDIRARAEAGFQLTMASGISTGLDFFYDGIGVNDFEAYGFGGKVSVPF